jgi:hypothetical protein
LPEDEQTSKHEEGGRYNAILEFKRGANKKREKERKKEKNICMRKRNKCEYV